jgi:hypothetical protein
MPALNEAQRQKQIAIAKKGKAKPKPKAGQKGQQTGNKGATTKAQTIGGAKPAPKPAAKPKPTVADYQDAQGNTYDGNSGQLKVAAPKLRSPAIGAPVHAKPSAFGSAQGIATGSAYVSSIPQRPSTPGQAVQQQANPYQAMGDIRGQQIPEVPIQQDAPMTAGQQEYGGQKLQGVDNNGVDMERRRAFLDADNSLDGMKAVRDLLNRRKLSIAVEH